MTITTLTRSTRALAAAALFSLSLVARAEAQSHAVTIVNLDEADFEVLQITESANDNWGWNLLDAGPLPPDYFLLAEPDNLFGSCDYDIRIIDSEGYESVLHEVDLCEATEVRFYFDGVEIDYADGTTDVLFDDAGTDDIWLEDAGYMPYH